MLPLVATRRTWGNWDIDGHMVAVMHPSHVFGRTLGAEPGQTVLHLSCDLDLLSIGKRESSRSGNHDSSDRNPSRKTLREKCSSRRTASSRGASTDDWL